MNLTLHGYPFSANSHRVKMFLSILGLPFQEVKVDLARGEHKAIDFIEFSSVGKVPVLTDGDVTIFDSHAIVLYLGETYGDGNWLPQNSAEKARVSQWLFFDTNELHNGIGYARNFVSFKIPTDIKAAQSRGHAALAVLEKRLASKQWLELDRPTLADFACYPLSAVAEEAGILLEDYPSVRSWIARIEKLPGALAMPRLKG